MTSPFDSLRKAAQGVANSVRNSRLARAMSRMTSVIGDKLDTHSLADALDLDLKSADHRIVKSMLPRSCFTKRGPGVTTQVRDAWRKMTPDQRATCVDRGWIHATQRPYASERLRKERRDRHEINRLVNLRRKAERGA